MSVYSLENNILRNRFNDPCIHFAINCASTSCPFLPPYLFDAENLDNYLEELTSDFINNQGGVHVADQKILLSEIFKMYADDFGGEDQMLKFIKSYWDGDSLDDTIEIQYQEYDWSLNR